MAKKLNPISEDEFTDQVVELLSIRGWMVVHFRKARKKDGRWMTPIKGHVGSPDILAARFGQVLMAELKVGRNKPTPEQELWLHHAGKHAFLWYPKHWDQIVLIAEKGLSI